MSFLTELKSLTRTLTAKNVDDDIKFSYYWFHKNHMVKVVSYRSSILRFFSFTIEGFTVVLHFAKLTMKEL